MSILVQTQILNHILTNLSCNMGGGGDDYLEIGRKIMQNMKNIIIPIPKKELKIKIVFKMSLQNLCNLLPESQRLSNQKSCNLSAGLT